MKKNSGYIILGASVGVLALSSYLLRKQIKTYITSGKVTDAQKKQFIAKIEPAASVIGHKYGIPPDFITAQLALESKFGKSELAAVHNNFGGIKAVGMQPGVTMQTTECANKVCRKVYRKFASFKTPLEGLNAQAKIYTNKYFKQYLNKTSDPIQYAKLLQSGKIKYATALNYPQAIQTTINEIKRLKAA